MHLSSHQMKMYGDIFVSSFTLCEALYAYGALVEDLTKDNESVEAEALENSIKYQMGWKGIGETR
jgi:hypothetical protein